MRLRIFSLGALTDLILLYSGFFYDLGLPVRTWQQIILLIVIIIVFLRRNRRLKKMFFLQLLFLLFFLPTLDVMILFLTSVYGWYPPLLALFPASYILAVYVRSMKFLQWDWLQCLFLPFILTAVLAVAAEWPQSRAACECMQSNQGVKWLIDSQSGMFSHKKVRNFLELKGPSKFLLSYRKNPQSVNAFDVLNCFDLHTGQETPWLPAGEKGNTEVIGLHRHPFDGNIYAVVINFPSREKHEGNYNNLSLLKFDINGNIISNIPLPCGGTTHYSADLFSFGKELFIVVEFLLYNYNPDTEKIEYIDNNSSFFSYKTIYHGDSLFGVKCHTPLIGFAYGSNIQKYDLAKDKVTAKKRGSLLGYWDLQEMDKTGRFIASNLFLGGGVEFDQNLQFVRKLNIPAGVRSFCLDKEGKYLFAPNFCNGYLTILDLERNELLKKTCFVGKGTRALKIAENGNLLIGNSCGLVEVDLDIVLPVDEAG